LVTEGVDRLFNPQPIEDWMVVIIAAIALLIDIATAMLTYRMAKTSMNIRTAFIHNLSDAMASLGVIVGGTLIILYEWLFVDAIVTIVIAVYILGHAAIEILKPIHILMQGVPVGLDIADVTADLQRVPGVKTSTMSTSGTSTSTAARSSPMW
jgi:cobalt-zinc-cadmium efflux system protein